MKVRLTIDLELPDDTPLVAEAYHTSLGELISDAYTHYVTCGHNEDAMKWCARGKIGSDNEDTSAKQIYLFHRTWAEICSNAKWDFDVIE